MNKVAGNRQSRAGQLKLYKTLITENIVTSICENKPTFNMPQHAGLSLSHQYFLNNDG
jgi:hypothetical protein